MNELKLYLLAFGPYGDEVVIALIYLVISIAIGGAI